MRVALATAFLLSAVLLASCGSARQVAVPATVGGHGQASASRAGRPLRYSGLARATAIARKPYRQEAHGWAAPASLRRIGRDRVLLSALGANDPSATRAAALHQLFLPHYHVVRLRVLRGSRSLVDVGGRFVSAGGHIELRTAAGRPLGRLEASIQDVIGFVKLVHRRSGAQAVVRGSHGHVATLLPAAAKAKLPAAGRVRIGGRSYVVRSFRETGFAAEPLRVWILVRH
jgi:hypothetical protein